MENNYVQGGKGLGDNYLPANPYAAKGMLVNKFPQLDGCAFYASIGWAVAADGLTATITPLTGNLSGDLRYYRVEIGDGQNTVTAQLDLLNRTTNFVVNTSTLVSNIPWTFAFYGEDGTIVGEVGCGVGYTWLVSSPKGATGDTIPNVNSWDNVRYLLKLDASSDAAYTLFPSEGVELSRNSAINLQEYSTNGFIANGESYEFKLFAKKVGLNPSIAIPVAPTAEVINAVAGNVTFPFPLSTDYVDIADLEIETATPGTFSEALSSVLTNEGVTPSIQVTFNTLVV